jgi:predicted transcriptional regulator
LKHKGTEGAEVQGKEKGLIVAIEVRLSPQLEAELKRIASERGCFADQLVQDILEAYMDHEKWFKAEVEDGLSQLDNGESVSDDEIVTSIQQLFRL